GAALHRGAADPGKNELDQPQRLERAMRKVTMVKAGKRENAESIKKHGNAHRQPAPADEEDQQNAQVHTQERDGTGRIKFLARFELGRFAISGRAQPGEDLLKGG